MNCTIRKIYQTILSRRNYVVKWCRK